MVKLIFLCRRRPDLTHEQYVERVLRGHAPLALRHHPTMRGYVVNVVERRLGTGGDAWDGFTELHFSSAEPIAGGLFDSPEGERAVRDDIALFIGRAGAYRVAEYVFKLP